MNDSDRIILKYTKYLTFFLSKNYDVLDCSDSSLRLLGATPQEVIKNGFWSFVHPNDKVRIEQLILSQEHGYEEDPCQRMRFLNKSKIEAWFDVCVAAISDHGELKFMVSGIPVVDLSEREKGSIESEAALNDSEELGKMGSWWVNIETMKNHWSKGNYTLWDCEDRNEPPPVSWVMDQLVPEDGKKIMEAIKRVNETGMSKNIMFRRPKAEGERTYLTRIRPWYIDGKLQEVKGVNIDITDIIKVQNELEIKNEELQLKNEKLSKYAFMNSHEIRGPLSNILGIAELMKANELSKLEILELMEVAGKQLDDAIRKANEILTAEGFGQNGI
ncbi:MAG: PAS domain-containing protein [Flavobacteriales bacterium]|nr:PAS domain-containing protein [Flavobacteriales bacterium]